MVDIFLPMLRFTKGVSAARSALFHSARRREAVLILGTFLVFFLLDWALLAALPALGLSYGPVGTSLAAISLVRLLLLLALFVTIGLWTLLHAERGTCIPNARSASFGLLMLWALNLGDEGLR